MKSVVFVHGDDWVGMYVDGVLRLEGHSLSPERVSEALGFVVDLDAAPDDDVLNDYLESWGSLPDKLTDIQQGVWYAPTQADRM